MSNSGEDIRMTSHTLVLRLDVQLRGSTRDCRGCRQCSVSFRNFKIQISQPAAEEFVRDSWGDQSKSRKTEGRSRLGVRRGPQASNLAWSRLVGPKASCRLGVGWEVRRQVVEEKTAWVLRWWSFGASS
ncbi:hypothetical protein TIFTF001_029400 [Ficus carica]|uniref:Uncharacterized protein n=1 Tax=Ficus carica TaxID=3494 RepID=A0AA88J2T1_FICCA|nr:hypothetical protein TIFTF001_029400 [Ficus carica]